MQLDLEDRYGLPNHSHFRVLVRSGDAIRFCSEGTGSGMAEQIRQVATRLWFSNVELRLGEVGPGPTETNYQSEPSTPEESEASLDQLATRLDQVGRVDKCRMAPESLQRAMQLAEKCRRGTSHMTSTNRPSPIERDSGHTKSWNLRVLSTHRCQGSWRLHPW